LEVDVVEQLPWDHVYRNPEYKFEEVKVKESTEKSTLPPRWGADLGFRGKILGVEASIPQNWYKAGDTIPISLTFTPTGYKKVHRLLKDANSRLDGLRLRW